MEDQVQNELLNQTNRAGNGVDTTNSAGGKVDGADLRDQLKQQIESFWQDKSWPQMRDLSLRLAEELASARPDLLQANELADLGHTLIWILLDIHQWFLDQSEYQTYYDDPEKMGVQVTDDQELVRQIMNALKIRPYTKDWLIADLAPAGDLVRLFSDNLLHELAQRSQKKDLDRDVLIDRQFGNEESAGAYMMDLIMRRSGFIEDLAAMIAAEDDLAGDPYVYKKTVPEAADDLLDDDLTDDDLDDDFQKAGSACAAFFHQNVFLIEGRSQRSLRDCLACYARDQLLIVAHNQQIVVPSDATDEWLIQALTERLPAIFLEDILYLPIESYNALTDLSQQNGKMINFSEMMNSLDLLRSGYAFLFSRYEIGRLFLPAELAAIIAANTARLTQKQFVRKQEIEAYLMALAHLYGVFKLDQLLDVWLLHHPEESATARKELRAEMRNAARQFSRRSAVFSYHPPYIHCDYLKAEDVETFWDRCEREQRPFFMPDQADIYNNADLPYDSDSAAFHSLEKAVGFLIRSLDEDEQQDFYRDLSLASLAEEDMERVFDLFDDYDLEIGKEKQIKKITQAYLDYSNRTPKWRLRGYSPTTLPGR